MKRAKEKERERTRGGRSNGGISKSEGGERAVDRQLDLLDLLVNRPSTRTQNVHTHTYSIQ